MKTTKTMMKVALLAAVMTACGGVDGERAPSPAAVAPVALEILDEARDDFDQQAMDDYARLARSVREMSETLGVADDPTQQIKITYLGRGQFTDEQPELSDLPEVPGAAGAPIEAPGYMLWDTVSVASGNEFRVAFPSDVLDLADLRANQERLNLGSDVVTAADEAEERATPPPEDPFGGPELEPIVLDDGTVVEPGISNANDTRSVRGTLGVAQTHTAFRKLVDIGGCSGTMFGPKHIVTAAHCVRNFSSSSWVNSTARAGRSTSAWRDSVAFSTSDTWYWTPSSFRSIADGQANMPYSATPYDIGVVVTHGKRIGNTVGWMGWAWWWTNNDFGNRVRYNRGYPLCGRTNSPANCQTNALYGDSQWCAVGEHSSPDSDGINRRFRFACDASAGHSGSSLYHYLNGSSLVVTSVVSWEHCTTCSANDDRPNTGVRITKSYAGSLSWLRQTFP